MTRLRVLLIEDNEDDATIILRELRRAGYEAVAERVATAGGLRAALARQAWDLVSCDCNLPGFGALAALALIGAVLTLGGAARPSCPSTPECPCEAGE